MIESRVRLMDPNEIWVGLRDIGANDLSNEKGREPGYARHKVVAWSRKIRWVATEDWDKIPVYYVLFDKFGEWLGGGSILPWFQKPPKVLKGDTFTLKLYEDQQIIDLFQSQVVRPDPRIIQKAKDKQHAEEPAVQRFTPGRVIDLD